MTLSQYAVICVAFILEGIRQNVTGFSYAPGTGHRETYLRNGMFSRNGPLSEFSDEPEKLLDLLQLKVSVEFTSAQEITNYLHSGLHSPQSALNYFGRDTEKVAIALVVHHARYLVKLATEKALNEKDADVMFASLMHDFVQSTGLSPKFASETFVFILAEVKKWNTKPQSGVIPSRVPA